HAHRGPRFLWIGWPLAGLVFAVGGLGIAAGIAGALMGQHLDVIGLIAIVALVGAGQALSIEVERTGSISVSAVGALAGAAIIGPRAALAVALTAAIVEWSGRRSSVHQFLFNVGGLTLASLAAAEVFAVHPHGVAARPLYAAIGVAAGFAYFAVNTGLIAAAIALEGKDTPWRVWRERFGW